MLRELEEHALMKQLRFAVATPLLLVGLTVIQGCSSSAETEDISAVKDSPLRNGSDVTERMKGVIELNNAKDGTRCTGLLLNSYTILTTAHCAARLTRTGERDETAWGIQWNTYGWAADVGFTKHCYQFYGGVCPLGTGKIETKDIRLFSLSMSPDNDLAILYRAWYPLTTWLNDFADIYLDDITPTNTPRLQLYSWGLTGDGNPNPLPKPRTGTMRVVETTAGHVKLTADQIQGCVGDEGGPWTIPGALDATSNAAVALESHFAPDNTTKCSAVNGTEYAVRLADKVDWIRSVDSSCAPTVNTAGHNVLRCYALSCDGASDQFSAGWDGCRGSGCSVCSELIDAYPKYFEHHRNCSRNTTCDNAFYRCSENCPVPTEADR